MRVILILGMFREGPLSLALHPASETPTHREGAVLLGFYHRHRRQKPRILRTPVGWLDFLDRGKTAIFTRAV